MGMQKACRMAEEVLSLQKYSRCNDSAAVRRPCIELSDWGFNGGFRLGMSFNLNIKCTVE